MDATAEYRPRLGHWDRSGRYRRDVAHTALILGPAARKIVCLDFAGIPGISMQIGAVRAPLLERVGGSLSHAGGAWMGTLFRAGSRPCLSYLCGP
jgi:hypothetical protein